MEFVNKMKDDAKKGSDGASSGNFKGTFILFAKFGDRSSEDDLITLKNIDKWLKQANILDGKKVTNADTAITFSKVAKTKKRVSLEEFEEFLEQLAIDKNMDKNEMRVKLISCGQPGHSDVTKPITGGAVGANVEAMTDTSQYTGSHRERFDEEGRGRGVEGREDRPQDSGYVTGYKGKDSYDSKHKSGSKDDDEEV